MSLLIVIACALGMSALAWYMGAQCMRQATVGKIRGFFDTYYAQIKAKQPDEWHEAYCRGAREMFEGFMAELGFKVIVEPEQESTGTRRGQ